MYEAAASKGKNFLKRTADETVCCFFIAPAASFASVVFIPSVSFADFMVFASSALCPVFCHMFQNRIFACRLMKIGKKSK